MEKQAETANAQSDERKPCVACDAQMPAHAVVCSQCLKQQTTEKASPMKTLMTWIGYTTAILGLLATLSGGVHWLTDHRRQQAEISSRLALAATQVEQHQYEPAVHTYQAILDKNPQNTQAADAELKTVMLWVQNFSIATPEGQDSTGDARQKLDEIFTLLEAARARVHGSQADDVLAHIGWTHWLNSYRKFGQRESEHAAEENLTAALGAEPSNVYANAMLGNVLLQTGGSLQEAVGHFTTALKTGKERPLVRTMQIGGLLGMESSASASELIKAANDMRKNGESLDEEKKSRISSHVYSGYFHSPSDFVAVLSAVPPDESLATYQWLDGGESGDESHTLMREYVTATLLEISGKPAEALDKFRAMQTELKRKQPGTVFDTPVKEAIKRLSQATGTQKARTSHA